MERIKLNFQKSEKELPKIPQSLDELRNLFHQLFPHGKQNLNYKFLIRTKDENISISENVFQNPIEELFEDEQDCIIYVVIKNNNDNNPNNGVIDNIE